MEKNIKAKRKFMCLALLLGFHLQSHAELSWNGFISVGGGIANPEEGESLFFYEEDLTFEQGTRLGLQVHAPISEKLSATGQMVAEGLNDFDVGIEWAYLSYHATDEVTFKFGRFRTPFYLYSDFLNVGYAYNWISPPTDVYNVLFDSIDGADITYKQPVGDTDLTVQVYHGASSTEVDFGTINFDVAIRNQTGAVLTLDWNWLTFRASSHVAEKVSFRGFENVNAELITTLRGLAALPVPGAEGFAIAADNLLIDERKWTFDEIALEIEWNNFLFVAEKSQLIPDGGPLAEQHGEYVSLGYTFGPLTILGTRSIAEDVRAPLSGYLPPGIPDPVTSAGLAFVLDAISNSSGDPDRTTDTIGLRWDFDPSASFKLEYIDISNDIGDEGSIVRFSIDSVF